MSMEGTRNSVGSGSTAPFTSLIWPGMVLAGKSLGIGQTSDEADRQRL